MSTKNVALISRLRHWLNRFDPHPAPDADLVRRFAEFRDESAFAALLDLHGPMVLGVARRIVGDHHTAEDVFQATFLVLTRKAGRVRNPAAWLHHTAHNLALTAVRSRERRERAESAARIGTTASPLEEVSSRELLGILDEELQRLPEKLRLPLILCCLEGRSQDEAAGVLGWTAGAVKGRLERGRQRLKDRLARRGVVFAVGVGVPLLAAPPSIAAVRLAALEACRAGASPSAAVSALLHAAMRPVFSPALKTLLAVAAIGLLAAGGALALLPDLASREPPRTLAPVGVDQVKPVAADAQAAEPLPQGAPARLGSARFRSDGEIQRLAYSPNGKILAGQVDASVILWDAATGQEIRRLPVRTTYPNIFGGIAFSPDNSTLAVIEGDGVKFISEYQIGLWDIDSGKKTRTLLMPAGNDRLGTINGSKVGNRLSYTPDGKSLVTLAGLRSDDGKPVVLDIASGEVRATLRSEGTTCYKFTLSPDGKTLAAAVDPTAVQIWDLATGKLIHTVRPAPTKRPVFGDDIRALAFSPDSKTLIFVVPDGFVRIDVATGKDVAISVDRQNIQNVHDLAITPDGTKLVFGFQRPVVQVDDAATGKLLHTLGKREFPSIAITGGTGATALSPDGKTVAYGGRHSVLTIWDLAAGKELFTENVGHKGPISSIAFSPDGKTLVSADGLLQIHSWNVTTRQDTGILPRSAQTLAFSPDGKQVALIQVNDDTIAPRLKSATRVRFWDLSAAKETLVISVPDTQIVRSAAFSPGGQKIFTLDWSSERQSRYCVRHWDVATGKQEGEWPLPHREVDPKKPNVFKSKFTAQPQPLLVLSLAPDGKTVFAADNDVVTIYDTDVGRTRLFTGTAKSKVLALAPSSDSRLVAVWLVAKNLQH